MPLPVDVKHGTEPSLRGRFRSWLRRPAPNAAPQPGRTPALAPPPAVDRNTRTFWARTSPAEARVAELVRAHERGDADTASRPRGNPAFSEALFVELMRAHQYRRAYDQLSDECRRRWGSAEAFAAAQGTGPLRRLHGVRVLDVRYLERWTDPDAGRAYSNVAELRVEYSFGDAQAPRVIPRVVHLVPDCGKWRSLCYPAA